MSAESFSECIQISSGNLFILDITWDKSRSPASGAI